jgi:hypothetical protein
MAKSKEISEKNVQFAKGGKTPMVPQQHAGPKRASIAGKDDKSDGGKFARGGPSKKMAGSGAAAPANPGRSAP